MVVVCCFIVKDAAINEIFFFCRRVGRPVCTPTPVGNNAGVFFCWAVGRWGGVHRHLLKIMLGTVFVGLCGGGGGGGNKNRVRKSFFFCWRVGGGGGTSAR